MKIAIFTDLYLEATGGIPSSIHAQKTSLENLGHQVTIFCPGTAKAPYKKTDNVIIVPTCRHLHPGGAPLARNPLTIKQWVIDNYPMFSQFDIVHVHYEAGASIAGALLAHQFKIPLVQTMHGREDIAASTNIPHPFRTLVASLLCWFHAWYLPRHTVISQDNYLANTYAKARMWTLMVNQANYADVVLTPSSHFGKKLKHYGVKSPIFTLSNGVSDDLVGDHTWPIRQLHPGQPLKIIWNSRVSKEKRILPFLQAVKLANIPIELDIYGDGNQLRQTRRFAAKNHMLTNKPSTASSSKKSIHKSSTAKNNPNTASHPAPVHVRFHGTTPHHQILQAMEDKHLSATMSYGFDTQGLTLLEAEATGLPVIYCDPDLGEPLPKDGGILTKSPEPADIASALCQVYAHPERIAAMSSTMLAQCHHILQSRQTKRLLKIYQALLS